MASSPSRRDNHGVASSVSPVPLIGIVFGMILSFAAISVLSCFLTQRVLTLKTWRRLPFITWLILAIYADSWIFMFTTAIIHYRLGVNSNIGICSVAIILCLAFYLTTKLIYLFLAERASLIQDDTGRRVESKVYLFNLFGIPVMCVAICTLNFVYRISWMDNGKCIIGVRTPAIAPLIAFDALVNTYLTILFLNPLRDIYTLKSIPRTLANFSRLRSVATRTLTGALCMTTVSVVNLTVLMTLDGEPAWVCLMCCNVDILFSTAAIQWITSRDDADATGDSLLAPSSSPDTRTYRRRRLVLPQPSSQGPMPLKATSASQCEHVPGTGAETTGTNVGTGPDIVAASGKANGSADDDGSNTGNQKGQTVVDAGGARATSELPTPPRAWYNAAPRVSAVVAVDLVRICRARAYEVAQRVALDGGGGGDESGCGKGKGKGKGKEKEKEKEKTKGKEKDVNARYRGLVDMEDASRPGWV